jgi:hypothetical protein
MLPFSCEALPGAQKKTALNGQEREPLCIVGKPALSTSGRIGLLIRKTRNPGLTAEVPQQAPASPRVTLTDAASVLFESAV